ncbi:MAG TPA: c-type cytochrome [Candidatus Eisenbacteria bacterium]
MRWTRAIGATLVAIACATTCLSLACAPRAPEQAAAPKPDPIARGRYLAQIAGCMDCHTPGSFYGARDTTRQLAGSDLGWAGPWGVVHARNLTPDSATGIGSWTIDQIVTAIRTGNTPNGTQLSPLMPWLDFSQLTDDDAHALAAYLKSIPAVSHQNLDRIPPGKKPTGANVVFPPPPAWDAPKGPPPGGGPSH